MTVIALDDQGEQLIVLVAEAVKLLGSVRAASAAISADGRFAVWARYPSGNAAASAEYYAAAVHDLATPASNAPAGLPARVVYPEPTSGLHVLASTIDQVDDATFAFLDFSQQARDTRVVWSNSPTPNGPSWWRSCSTPPTSPICPAPPLRQPASRPSRARRGKAFP